VVTRKRDYSSKEIDLALAAFALEGGRGKPVEKLLRAASLKVPLATVRGWAYDTHSERYQQILLEVEQQVRSRLADDFHRLARTSTELSEDILRRIKAQLDRKDEEFQHADERFKDAERRLEEINTFIDLDQRELATTIELPDVDSLIEEILSNPGDLELDPMMVAKLNGAYKRRESIVGEIKAWWQRRCDCEVTFKELAKLLHESAVMGGISTEKLALLTGQATDRVEHSFPELQRALEAKGIRLNVGQGAPRALPAPVIDLPAGDG
jgi:predicted nuclease with TOPRIM domain